MQIGSIHFTGLDYKRVLHEKKKNVGKQKVTLTDKKNMSQPRNMRKNGPGVKGEPGESESRKLREGSFKQDGMTV